MTKRKEPMRFDLELPPEVKASEGDAPDVIVAHPDEEAKKALKEAVAKDTSPPIVMVPEGTKLDRELAEKELRADLLEILKEPRVKGQIMGVVDFHPATPDGHLKWRHIMVDLSHDVFFRAWERYKQDHPDPSAEAFIYLVFNIMDVELPRLHKDIWHDRLE